MKGFIVSTSNKNIDGQVFVQLFGRLENGKSFATSNRVEPYFFVREKDYEKNKKLFEKYKVVKTKETNFNKESVVKVTSNDPAELGKLSYALHKKNNDTYEADINPQMRFIIDNDLLGSIEIDGDHEQVERVDYFFREPKIKPAEAKVSLKVLSIDLESNKHSEELFCVSLYGNNYRKSFIVSSKKVESAVSCKSEEDLLQKLKEEIISYDPDVITGWHVIDFDLLYLKKKFDENKISFDIGRTNENARIKIESGFFKSSTASVPGRQVLDGLNMIKDPFIQEAPIIKNKDFESYTLEDVSQSLLGEGKLLKGKGRHDEIEILYKKDQKKLIEYNLQDAKLAYDILEKTKMIDLAVERCSLTGLPLNRLTASIAAFDSLYIREARKRGLVSPTTHYQEREERIKGGFVMEAKPGIYHNVLVLDFKSLYPSIIKTFNIDPSSYLEKKEKNAVHSPNGAYFRNENGILPQIIAKLHEAREKAKKEKRELSSYAIKIIMNSFFGVLASPNCRYYSLQMANAITHFGQMIIQLTAKKIEEKGYKIIYSDTDSVFVETSMQKEKADQLGLELQNHINEFYKKYIKEEYSRNSYLELEFEKQYIAFLLPKVRGSEEGSKKRYAGLTEENGKENIEVVGLEAIRGDWTEAAQEFQKELLSRIFHRQEFAQFIKDYVKKIRSGKMDSQLIYRKSLRKPLDEYTKTTPPHVKAARKLDKVESNVIEYYITVDGPEPVQKLKHHLDYDHYIEKQIAPIADTILFFFNKTFEEIMQAAKQTKLF